MDKPAITDEQLTAFLDGEAEPVLKRAIQDSRAKSPTIERRLAALSIDDDAVKAAFEAILPLAPAYSVPAAIQQNELPKSKWRATAVGALAALCLVTGWGTATILNRDRAHAWQQQAAIYHSLYVSSTLNVVQSDHAVISSELMRVSAALGKNLALSDLGAVPDLDYKRSQVLGFDGRPLIQVAYLSQTGTPVVLCIYRTENEANKPVSRQVLEGMNAATWSKGKFEFLLIGGSDAELITRAANRFFAIL